MTTIDTNILVYAHREEFKVHKQAKALITGYAEGDDPWILLWTCIYEFLRIVTHPRLFNPPTPVDIGMEAITALANSSAIILHETEEHFKWFHSVILDTKCKGNHVFDAHIAALMREHGIDEIITTDRDFYQFKGIKVTIPF